MKPTHDPSDGRDVPALLVWGGFYLGCAGLVWLVPELAEQRHLDGVLAGLAAALLACGGLRHWPVVALGSALCLLPGDVGAASAVYFVAGRVLAAVVFVLVLGGLKFVENFSRSREIALLAVAAVAGGAPLATGTALGVAGGAAWVWPWRQTDFWHWWAGFAITTIVVAPVLLAARGGLFTPLLERKREAVLWLGCTVLLNSAIFGMLLGDHYGHLAPFAYLPLLLVGWGAMRFGVAGTVTGILFTASVMCLGTVRSSPGLDQLWPGIETDWFHLSGVILFGWLTSGMLLERQRAFDRLHASEGALRLRERALGEVRQGVLIAGPDRKIVYANSGFESLTGYTAAEIRGLSCRVLHGPETNPDTVERIRAALAAERPFEGEILNYRKDGTTFWNEVRLHPVRGERGELQWFVGIQRDVTARRQSAAALAESEQRFRQMADQAPMLVWMSDPDERCVYLNRAWLEFTGRTLEQELGEGWTVGVHPEDLARCREINADSFRRREPFELEYRLRRADGSYRWILDRGVPRHDAAGIFIGFIGSCVDVHERHTSVEALHENQRFLRAVLDQAPIGIWMQDVGGRLRFVNAAFCQAVGITEARFVAARHYSELLPPEVTASCLASDRAALAQATPHVSRERLPFVDGRTHDLDIIKVRLTDGAGGVQGLVGLSLDVTAQLQTEAQNRLLSSALESAANAVVITDRDGRIEWVNAAFTTLTSYTVDEARGRRPGELVNSGRHAPEFFRQMWETILAGRVWQGRLVNRRKDGTPYHEDQTITPLLDGLGRVTHFISIKQNITELTEARRELGEAEERYRLLFDRGPIPMWVFDVATLEFLAVNDTAVRHYGHSREEFLRMTLRDIRPPEDVPVMLARVAELAESGAKQAGEWRHRCKDGRILHVLVESSLVHYEGRPAGFTVALDVTEKKRMEEQLQRTQRLENLGLLAAGIAHDLNNVLSPFFIAVPMLRENARSEDDRRMLGLVQQGADRGAALVRQILSFARGGVGDRQLVQAKHLLREVAALMQETFPKNITVQVKLAGELWPVVGDPVQIHQLLLNLCVNARDAMPAGGTLTVRARNAAPDTLAALLPDAPPGRPCLLLEVADTGTGIAPEVLPQIWEPFFTTKAKGQGTGLGLSTVRGIVIGHHGACGVESVPGAGTVFRIALPAEILHGPAREGKVAATSVSVGQGELILVVEDEPSVRQMVRLALSRAGYRVLVAGDGEEGLACWRARRGEIFAVISDTDMPKLDGLGMVQAMLQAEAKTRVIMISGATNSVSLPGVEFMAKPFDMDQLFRRLEKIAEKPGGIS